MTLYMKYFVKDALDSRLLVGEKSNVDDVDVLFQIRFVPELGRWRFETFYCEIRFLLFSFIILFYNKFSIYYQGSNVRTLTQQHTSNRRRFDVNWRRLTSCHTCFMRPKHIKTLKYILVENELKIGYVLNNIMWRSIEKTNKWRSVGKGELVKTLTSNSRYRMYLNFDVKRFAFGKYSLSYGSSHISKLWR